MKKDSFSSPIFKFLSKNDSGMNSGHQAGILIPVGLRGYFPKLDATTSSPVPSISITLEIERGRAATKIQTRYQKQTWNMTRSGETRITGDLEVLRGLSKPDDILMMQRSRDNPLLYRASILHQGTKEHQAVANYAGKSRWGVFPKFLDGMLSSNRRMIGRLDRVESTIVGSCWAFEFDAIDADLSPEELDSALNDPEVTAPFALVRIISDRSRLEGLLGSAIEEGMWIELALAPGKPGEFPPGAVAQLTPRGYLEQERGIVHGMRIVADRDERPRDFPGIGAAVPQRRQRAVATVLKCGIPVRSVTDATAVKRALRPLLTKAAAVVVRDVGQASFNTVISSDGQQLVHFDAGWPISYNGRTAPKELPDAGGVPVVLSHWDWDHLHAYHRIPALASVYWIVPHQPIGPGATKMANALHARKKLMTYRGPNISVGQSSLISCTGSSGMNDTGFALDLSLANGKRALLVGDASYIHLGASVIATQYDYLVVTHHGSDFVGTVPLTKGSAAKCAISVGQKNVYGHPRSSALLLHTSNGWPDVRTSKNGSIARGPRTLG